MSSLSYNTRRAICGIVLVPSVLCLLNDWAKLNWLGEYGRMAAGIALMSMVIVVVFWGPTASELEDMRAKARKTVRAKRRKDKDLISK